MATMKRRIWGDDVAKVQRRLSRVGFNPGEADGKFGPAMAAAVQVFQASEGLLVNGIGGRTHM